MFPTRYYEVAFKRVCVNYRTFKMSDNKNKDMKNPMAEAANWEARCVTEEEAHTNGTRLGARCSPVASLTTTQSALSF